MLAAIVELAAAALALPASEAVVLDTLFRYHTWVWGCQMDLGVWLRSLGLAQYEAAFRENAINEAILPKLTAEDLKDIGVTAVGHRRVLLDAIAALRGKRPATGRMRPAPRPNPRASPTASVAGSPKPNAASSPSCSAIS